MATTSANTKPWYREPWPWLLMLGPVASVVAGIAMLALALNSEDGLVSDDYYKQGLAINRTLERDALAAVRQYRALALISPEADRIRLNLAGAGSLPDSLRLTLSHPTRSGRDQVLNLQQIRPGWYESGVRQPAAGRWRVILDDQERTWRMSGKWDIAAGTGIVFDVPAGRPMN